MYPKLYWESDGRERVVHTKAEDDDAIAAGWSDLPPGPRPEPVAPVHEPEPVEPMPVESVDTPKA